jgi:hypothetical protein
MAAVITVDLFEQLCFMGAAIFLSVYLWFTVGISIVSSIRVLLFLLLVPHFLSKKLNLGAM